MARIKMTQTIAGCMDGIVAKKYIKDTEYAIDGNEINQRLADMFLNANAAVIIRERKPVLEAPEKAVIEEAPQKKVMSVSESMKKARAKKEDQPDKKETESAIKTTRVFHLANELKVSYKELVKLANKLGIKAKAAQSGLSENDVKKIKANFVK